MRNPVHCEDLIGVFQGRPTTAALEAKITQMEQGLGMVSFATGLGDTRTLIIPVAPTIFWEAGAQVRADMGIADGLIRLSVGLEDSVDLLGDFEQALGQANA